MSEAGERFEGGCLCGAIRFVATGQPKGVAWCHCKSCRKHSGAPVSVFVAYERTAYTVTKGEIAKFESTPGKTERGFCARCGSTLTCETVGLPTLTDFHVGAFDDAELFRCFALPGTYFPMNGCRGCTWRTRKRRLALSPGRPLPGTWELSLSGAGDQTDFPLSAHLARCGAFRRSSPF